MAHFIVLQGKWREGSRLNGEEMVKGGGKGAEIVENTFEHADFTMHSFSVDSFLIFMWSLMRSRKKLPTPSSQPPLQPHRVNSFRTTRRALREKKLELCSSGSLENLETLEFDA